MQSSGYVLSFLHKSSYTTPRRYFYGLKQSRCLKAYCLSVHRQGFYNGNVKTSVHSVLTYKSFNCVITEIYHKLSLLTIIQTFNSNILCLWWDSNHRPPP
uniref:Uncharacterized protein n=1 Tax=Cacopsylla melanoneura TaxID=428564 RepID=A0A8D8XUG6_9HEMI